MLRSLEERQVRYFWLEQQFFTLVVQLSHLGILNLFPVPTYRQPSLGQNRGLGPPGGVTGRHLEKILVGSCEGWLGFREGGSGGLDLRKVSPWQSARYRVQPCWLPRAAWCLAHPQC